MAAELPEYVDPRPLAEQGRVLRGEISPRAFSRITNPYRAEKVVQVDLRFALDEAQHLSAQGSIRTELGAICQRCLNWMELAVELQIATLIVDAAAAAGMDAHEQRDYVVCADGILCLASFVEDEILLGAPMIPMHADPVCGAPAEGEEGSPAPAGKPFAGLDQLLKNASKE